jgi:hypothetical protein
MTATIMREDELEMNQRVEKISPNSFSVHPRL